MNDEHLSLQDVESGRALELDALVAAVIELGRITASPTPMIDAFYAAVSLLQRTLQAQQGRLRIESANSEAGVLKAVGRPHTTAWPHAQAHCRKRVTDIDAANYTPGSRRSELERSQAARRVSIVQSAAYLRVPTFSM